LGFIFLAVLTAAGCAGGVSKVDSAAPSDTAPSGEGELYEVLVKQVMMSYVDGEGVTPVIILANKEDEEQILPIWVGMSEGMSINMALDKHEPPRPGTHDLFTTVLGQFNMSLVKVIITDMREQTYIATMVVKSRGETKEIDARPSDAIALALRSVAPVFVSQRVLHKSGWVKAEKRDKNRREAKSKDTLL
jgi:bifunctional DNase/RNase